MPLRLNPLGYICGPIIDESHLLHLQFMELGCYHYQYLPPAPSKLPMHQHSLLVPTTQRHTPNPQIIIKKNCCSSLPPCSPHKKQLLITLYPEHNLLLLFCEIYFNLEDRAQLWSCCIQHGRWYQGSCKNLSPNSTFLLPTNCLILPIHNCYFQHLALHVVNQILLLIVHNWVKETSYSWSNHADARLWCPSQHVDRIWR